MHPLSCSLRGSYIKIVINQWMVVKLAPLLLALLFTGSSIRCSHAALSCVSHADCQSLLPIRSTTTIKTTSSATGSTEKEDEQKIQCLPDSNTCSNPYQQGCLRAKLGSDAFRKRVCNSNDDIDYAKNDDNNRYENCHVGELLHYPELRIHQSDWESSVFLAWIYQIVLEEILRVPVTVGRAAQDSLQASFYSPSNELVFSEEMYPYTALETANRIRDCSLLTSENEPCVHVLPEVWSGQLSTYAPLVQDKVIEPTVGNGMVGKGDWFVPAFTARQFPELAIFYGLQGSQRRQQLADVFRKPTTWLEYCRDVSPTQCQRPDGVALRGPETDEEEELYFAPADDNPPISANSTTNGLWYTGHFRLTDANNCTTHPDTCTGHIVVPPCHWSTNVGAQVYHNNIVGLQSRGPLPPHGGYTNAAMQQIWRAANQTQSHAIMYWWKPEALVVDFAGTPAEFQQVSLPTPSMECLRHRVPISDQCSEDPVVRNGDPAGACQDEAASLQQIIATSVKQMTAEASEVDRSPAYDFLRTFKISELDMLSILSAWTKIGKDKYGNDAREAVCNYVVEHLDAILESLPEGYPKTVDTTHQFGSWYLRAAIVFGFFVAALALVAIFFLRIYQESKAIVFAQPFFLLLILTGNAFVSVGAAMVAVDPTQATCTMAVWAIVLGYTISLIPVLVKTAAINSFIQSSKKMKRVNINRQVLLMKVFVITCGVVVFLICWTALDPPKRQEVRQLNAEDETIVQVGFHCSSDSPAWRTAALAWEIILLFLTAILAFQSRNVMQQLNESTSLATMAYSHFLFSLLRGVLSVFSETNHMPSSEIVALFSFNYSLDSCLAMTIYVLPKLLEARKAPEPYIQARATSRLASQNSSIHPTEGKRDLQILVCTANIGNAEPTRDSMAAWIPPGGACDRITLLEKKERSEEVTVPSPDTSGSDDSRISLDDVVFRLTRSRESSPTRKQSSGAQVASRADAETNKETALNSGTFDVIAIGMQESTWKPTKDKDAASPSNKKGEHLSEEDVLAALEERETVALREMIQDILGENFTQLVEEQRGQMRLHIWSSHRVAADITDIRISGANTGIGNMLANKGGIVATLNYKKTRISFVSSHLAAHEGESYYKSRCDNVRSILREAKTFDLSSKFDIAMSSHHMFWMGDLNFRTKFDAADSHEENVKRALKMVEDKDYKGLYEFDELIKGIEDGDLLVDFKTLPCLFPPTFKVEREPGFVYKNQRTPSYTDRILFKSSEGLGHHITPLSYEPCVDFITSDHKPVRGAFSITPNGHLSSHGLDSNVHMTFRNIECEDLPVANSNLGKADPYLMFLWDSVELEAEKEGIMDKLRKAFTGQSWPRTKHVWRNLNPRWTGNQVSLLAKNAVGSEALLFIAVIDYDAVGSDEFMCATAMNVKELVSGRLEEETIATKTFDRPLFAEGKVAGRIRFDVDLSLSSRPSVASLHARAGNGDAGAA